MHVARRIARDPARSASKLRQRLIRSSPCLAHARVDLNYPKALLETLTDAMQRAV